MKLSSLSVLCLSLLLLHAHFSLARGRGSSSRSSGTVKKAPTSNQGSSSSNSNRNRNNQGSSSQGSNTRQEGRSNQGGHSGSGRPIDRKHPRGGSPVQGSPYVGNHGGRSEGYGGGYMNHNPNNKIMSPGFTSSFGNGGYGTRGGSPFSHSVQSMGMYPTDRSRGFGRTAVMAASGGAVTGMAVGYGIGRYPRPPHHFHNRQEEQHYNHYMHKNYGSQSTDTNDYSRDYVYTPPNPVERYDSFMETCMNRTNLLSGEYPKPYKKPDATTNTSAVTSAQNSTNTTETNSTAAHNSSTSGSSLNPPVANPVPPSYSSSAEDDDTVSILEIGYPALIEQMKTRRCVELYMEDSAQYLMRVSGGVQGLETGSRGLLAVVTSTILMLLNSNMLTLLH